MRNLFLLLFFFMKELVLQRSRKKVTHTHTHKVIRSVFPSSPDLSSKEKGGCRSQRYKWCHNCAGFEVSHNLRVRDLTSFVPVAGMPGLQRADAELGEHSGYLTSWNIRNWFFLIITSSQSEQSLLLLTYKVGPESIKHYSKLSPQRPWWFTVGHELLQRNLY